MTKSALPLLGALLLGACASTPSGHTVQAGKPGRPGDHLTIRTTAYVASEPGGPHAATGDLLHYGGGSGNTYSCAADWSWLPLGTRFKMAATGRTYVVEDYGSALVGRKTVDLFMPNRYEMGVWGVRNVDIEILEWGSSVMSLRLLEPRQRNEHVRRMVAALLHRPGSMLAGG